MADKKIVKFDFILNYTKKELEPFVKAEINEDMNNRKSDTVIEKDKAYFENKKIKYSNAIKQILNKCPYTVRQNNTTCFSVESLTRLLVSEIIGFSVLTPLYEDDDVTDIYVIRYDTIFYEKNHKNYRFQGAFLSAKHYKDFLTGKMREANKELNNAEKKIVNMDLYGDRYCITSKAVTPKSESMTVRKHQSSHVTAENLLEQEVCSEEIMDFFECLIAGQCNTVIAGITGSGKTTTLRAILNKYLGTLNIRAIVSEDTRELFLDTPHVLEMVSTNEGNNPLTLRDVVLTTLRLKPRMNVIGEVRGPEIEAAVESAATGHATLFSMHGDKEDDVINRAELKYLDSKPSIGAEVAERMVCQSIDIVIIQKDIPDIGRKVTSISEISYDKEKRTSVITPIFKYNMHTYKFEKVGHLSDSLVEKMVFRMGPKQKHKLIPFAKEGYFDEQ